MYLSISNSGRQSTFTYLYKFIPTQILAPLILVRVLLRKRVSNQQMVPFVIPSQMCCARLYEAFCLCVMKYIAYIGCFERE